MTALPQYERLEATGLWRETAEAQRREVIVFFGDATLVIADSRAAQPLTHWSLAAVIRRNPGRRPAVFAPSEEPGEELEIDDDTMTSAIEKVLSALESARPHPGRLRGWLTGAVIACMVAAIAVWLPPALIRQAAQGAPAAKRDELGRAILADITRVSGVSPCHSTAGDVVLTALAERVADADTTIAILPKGLKGMRMLPGNIVLIDRQPLRGKSPEAVAGAVIATRTAAAAAAKADKTPMLAFLQWAGARAALKLLVTGDLPQGVARGYGQVILDTPLPAAPTEDLLAAFQAEGVSSTPYAYATDPTGETMLPLIEADPFNGKPGPRPVMKDAQWQALRAICD